jgi:hypothetical protein
MKVAGLWIRSSRQEGRGAFHESAERPARAKTASRRDIMPGFRTSENPPLLLYALVMAVVLLAWGPATAAEDLRVEAEEFEAYGANDLGGLPIAIEFCASASGYFTVDWIDVPGEWIKLGVTFVHEADYRSVLAYQAPYGEPVLVRTTILDYPEPGQSLSSEYLLDDGYGFG